MQSIVKILSFLLLYVNTTKVVVFTFFMMAIINDLLNGNH